MNVTYHRTDPVIDFYSPQLFSATPRGYLWYSETPSTSTVTPQPDNSTTEDPPCNYSKPGNLHAKVWLVALFGTVTSIVSVIENLALMYMFATRKQFRASNLFYMMFLAFCDVFVCVCYIALMSVSVLSEFFEVLWLYLVWHQYLRPVFAVSHIAMASSGFLIMAATIERCITTATNCQALGNYLKTHRLQIATFAMFSGVFCRGTVYWELEVNWSSHCKGFAQVYPYPSAFSNQPYYFLWKFWFRNITTVFLPFFVLAVCNLAIVCALRRQNRANMRTMVLSMAVGKPSPPAPAAVGDFKSARHNREKRALCNHRQISEDAVSGDIHSREAAEQTKASVRAATRMLILVVLCYLLANALNVFVTAWEFIDSDSLGNYDVFYNIAADVVSISTVIATAVRMPIYCLCNGAVRQQLSNMFTRDLCQFCAFCGRHSRNRLHRHRHSQSNHHSHITTSDVALQTSIRLERKYENNNLNGNCTAALINHEHAQNGYADKNHTNNQSIMDDTDENETLVQPINVWESSI